MAIAQSLDVDVVLRVLLDYLGQLVPYDRATAMLMERDYHLVVRLVRGKSGAEVVDPEISASFDASAIPVLREAILSERLSMKGPIERLGGVIIPESETIRMPGGRPESFLNVNRPEDYEELTQDARTLPSRR